MNAFDEANRDDDPCGQIQMDLSAMLDGELDPSSVRRVVVHSDACRSCREFLDGIRAQARSHRVLHRVLTGAEDERIAVPVASGSGTAGIRGIAVGDLRRQLTENRQQLAKIFYEIGRGFVLAGITPKFSRVVAKEPAPITDMCRRGRHLVDEVERLAESTGLGASSSAPGNPDGVGAEWIRAKQVFDEDSVLSHAENLRKGIALLQDALLLAPDLDYARIYLGHAHHVAGETGAAEFEFRRVLEHSEDAAARAFARMHLGNVHLDAGRPDLAENLFLELVSSGEVARRPQFGLIYFNLALASGMQGRFDDCRNWFDRLYSEMPHKRRMIADEIRAREDFIATLAMQPKVYDAFADRFPCWFPTREAC